MYNGYIEELKIIVCQRIPVCQETDRGRGKGDAYIFSQYFEDKKKINIVVGDFGIGIPGKANKYFEEEKLALKSSEDCIKWALELNQSSFSKPHNKGKGLNNIHSFVMSSDSRLRIFSNDAMFDCKKDEEVYAVVPSLVFRP